MKVLILSPHTDDAELGSGGSIIKLIEEGNDIFWIVFSTAEESLPISLPKDILKKEFLEVATKLQINDDMYKIFDFKVRNLNAHRQEILDILIEMRNLFNPNLVIGPSLNDFHQDHHVVANEMVRAFKTSSSIISFELPWNHITFNTQLFVKLSRKNIDKKFGLLQCYKSQILQHKAYFSEEFILGLARTRGTQCNSDYAESYEVIRWIL